MSQIEKINTINNENTTDKAHSIFPPSSASRHLNCTPSLVRESVLPSETSEAAEEGTAAHALAEYKARIAFGMPLDVERPTSIYDSEEMEDCTDLYVDFLKKCAANLKNPIVLLERVVHFDKYVPGGFGTSDCIMLSEDALHIIDYKHGRNLVEAEDNDQMKTYAVGALQDFSGGFPNIKRVFVSICQPRIRNIVTWSLDVSELREWSNKVLRPKGNLALMGEGEFNEGSWCRYCKARQFCPRKNKSVVDSISRVSLEKKGEMMSHKELNDLLPLAYEAKAWGERLISYAQTEAVENGALWNGYKLVEGKSRREFLSADKEKIIQRAEENNIPESDLYSSPELLSPAKLEKKVGAKLFREIFADLVNSKKSAPSLVPDSDPREEYTPEVKDIPKTA